MKHNELQIVTLKNRDPDILDHLFQIMCYYVNCIKKGSARTPLGIVDKFDTYETALKNSLLNKFAIETPNNKLQEVTLPDGSKELNYLPGTIVDYAALHS